MRRRVLVAGLYHKTNTFLGGRTTLEDFEVSRGRDLLRHEGGASPFAGMLEVAREKDWGVLPAASMHALPGATAADAVVDLFWAELRAVADAAESEGIDGVFLVLHGAMVSESHLDVEGEILRRIRGIGHLSDAPVCGTMDLHANFTEAMARQSDGLIAFRENPPADARKTARDAALLLDALMETADRPATVWDHPPIMWPPRAAATDSEPMSSLQARAREIETGFSDVVAVNVLAGFPYADVAEAGVSFSAVTMGDLETARAGLRELNVTASFRREGGSRIGMPIEEALLRVQDHREGPLLLVEPADSVWAGAPGDGAHLLRALVEYGVPDAGIVIYDPETVAALANARPGERRDVLIGGKGGDLGSEPLPLEVELVFKSDGRFVPENAPTWPFTLPGGEADMGPCSVVRSGEVTILLTSRRTPPFDLGQWRSQGVEPENLFAIGIKAAIEHHPAYDPIAKASYTIDLPGPCAEDLSRLPFERVSRPIYPLDEL